MTEFKLFPIPPLYLGYQIYKLDKIKTIQFIEDNFKFMSQHNICMIAKQQNILFESLDRDIVRYTIHLPLGIRIIGGYEVTITIKFINDVFDQVQSIEEFHEIL